MKWRTTLSDHPKISLEIVKQVEKELKVQFPADFLTVAMEHNEGSPECKRILVDGKGEVFHHLLSLHPEDSSYIAKKWKMLQSEYEAPAYIVPIARDPFGNFFCYDFHKKVPEIVFYLHEFDSDDLEAYSFVSSSFTQLVQSLHRID
jgi:hypothetical protein